MVIKPTKDNQAVLIGGSDASDVPHLAFHIDPAQVRRYAHQLAIVIG